MSTTAGYSGTPLARKLGIGAGDRLVTLHAPDHFPDLLGDLLDGVTVERDPPFPEGPPDPVEHGRDVVVLFARDASVLARDLEPARGLLAWDGGLWIAWPKGSSPLASDLGKFEVMRAGHELGLVDNKICAVDEDWSGLRMVYRREDRPREGGP